MTKLLGEGATHSRQAVMCLKNLGCKFWWVPEAKRLQLTPLPKPWPTLQIMAWNTSIIFYIPVTYEVDRKHKGSLPWESKGNIWKEWLRETCQRSTDTWEAQALRLGGYISQCQDSVGHTTSVMWAQNVWIAGLSSGHLVVLSVCHLLSAKSLSLV